jgi:hypothetical protein
MLRLVVAGSGLSAGRVDADGVLQTVVLRGRPKAAVESRRQVGAESPSSIVLLREAACSREDRPGWSRMMRLKAGPHRQWS